MSKVGEKKTFVSEMSGDTVVQWLRHRQQEGCWFNPWGSPGGSFRVQFACAPLCLWVLLWALRLPPTLQKYACEVIWGNSKLTVGASGGLFVLCDKLVWPKGRWDGLQNNQ